MSQAYELLAVFLSSTGILGGALSALLACMLRRAKREADRKHERRLALEQQRRQGEELLSALVLALAGAVSGATYEQDEELERARNAFRAFLERKRAMQSEIVSEHAVK